MWYIRDRGEKYLCLSLDSFSVFFFHSIRIYLQTFNCLVIIIELELSFFFSELLLLLLKQCIPRHSKTLMLTDKLLVYYIILWKDKSFFLLCFDLDSKVIFSWKFSMTETKLVIVLKEQHILMIVINGQLFCLFKDNIRSSLLVIYFVLSFLFFFECHLI